LKWRESASATSPIGQMMMMMMMSMMLMLMKEIEVLEDHFPPRAV
jgi:hypothetical protein